jgi:hypothetical protein
MALVPAAYPQSAVPRARRQVSGFTWARSVWKSLLICLARCRTDFTTPIGAARREGGARGAAACIFLLIPSRAGSNWAAHLAGGTAAAPHKSHVSINENTSAGRSAGDPRETGTHWNCYRNRRVAAACGAARGQNIKPEGARRRPGAASDTRSDSLPAERLKSRRPPSIVNPCRSLLITHPRGPAGNGRRIVKACRSLLIHRPCAEPVRSGGDRPRPDGHRLPRRPPSPLLESGGRP